MHPGPSHELGDQQAEQEAANVREEGGAAAVGAREEQAEVAFDELS